MMGSITQRTALLLLVLVSLGLYSGAVRGGFLSLDEQFLLQGLDNLSGNPWAYLFPSTSHLYYRPMLGLSMYWDQLLWGGMASGFHLTNILLHSGNALLVFFLASGLLKGVKERTLLAFLSALLFTVHPLHSEVVDWVSARTDLLATFFVLTAFVSYLSFREGRGWRWLVLSGLAYGLGLLSKESALALPLLVAAYEWLVFLREVPIRRRLWPTFVTLGPYFLITVGYFLLRSAGLSQGDMGVARSAEALQSSGGLLVAKALAAIGFYFKKLLIPFPLNFAIAEIPLGLYSIIGILVLGAGLFFLFKKGVHGFLFWWVLFSLFPPLIVAVNGMAWTPLAERYLYLPSVGFSILFVLVLASGCLRLRRPDAAWVAAVLLICVGFSAATTQRSLLWREPLLFWEDVVRKSPGFANAYNEYGTALAKAARFEESREQFQKAADLGYRAKSLYNLGLMASRMDEDYYAAKEFWTEAIEVSPENSRLYIKMAGNYMRMAGAEPEMAEEHYLKAVEFYEKAYRIDPAYHLGLYKIGQVYLRIGEYDQAKRYFQQVLDKAGQDVYIAEPSRKILGKLEGLSESQGNERS